MKNRKWIGLLCLALAVVLTAGAVLSAAAAGMVSDVDGDGRITAFDAQLIAESNAGKRQLSETQLSSIKGVSVRNILNFLLGDPDIDVGDTDGDGVQEIYTVAGLQQLREVPDGNYILMKDLDLEGADWEPIAGFSGSLNGNGKIIKNFTINTCVEDSVSEGIYNQAFFGDTRQAAVISDLHLQNVTVNAAAETTSMSFFTGCHRGQLTGCTVTGVVTDTREAYPANMYVGVFAGKLLNGYEGTIAGGTNLSFTDEYGRKTTGDLCADAAFLIENKTINLGSSHVGKVGLAGYSPSGYTVTGTWKDSSNSTELLSQVLRDRRQTVVDYMNAMATVEWTPTETLYYTAANGTDQTIVAGKVHVGLPYNFHNGSYERFMTQMDTQDENGVWTAVSGLESCGWDDSLVTKYYIRPYTNENSYMGAGIQRTKVLSEEILSLDADGYLYYATEEQDYYYGTDERSEYIHIVGNAATAYCMQLYDASGATPVPVTNPTENKTYKLAAKDADGVIWYFNGNSNTINGINSLITTKVLANAADVYIEVTDGGYRVCHDEQGAWTDTGFYLTMGNACNTSVHWAWKQVSSVFVDDGARNSKFGYEGGFYPRGAQSMIPTDYNRENYGMYPIGSWDATTVDETGMVVSAEWDPSKAAYECTDQTYTPEVLNDNGIDTIYEAYAQSRKGDALTCYVSHWTTGNPGPGGHVRMITGDPVVIRDAQGTIDGNASYLIETEQGVGFNRNNHDFPSSWDYARAFSFYEMIGKPTSMPTDTSTKTYLPMTIRALQEEYQPEAFLSEIRKSSVDGEIAAISPTTGLMYSSHSINSVTLTVVNGSGSVLYRHEAFTGISADTSISSDTNNRLYMADLHAEAFYEAADGLLRPNRSYYCHVDVTLSTGETIRLVENRAFTYTAP